MKLKDLLLKLSQFDPELEVFCYSEDEPLLSIGHGFRLLDIEGARIIEAEKVRADDGVPSLKLGKSEYSKKHIAIEVISDF